MCNNDNFNYNHDLVSEVPMGFRVSRFAAGPLPSSLEEKEKM